MYIVENEDGTTSSFNFVAPKGVEEKKTEVLFPFFQTQSIDYDATIELAINQMQTKVTIGKLTGDLELSAAIDSQVSAGAMLILAVETDSTSRTITFSSGIDGADLTIEANQSKILILIFDGDKFLIVNSLQQKVVTSEVLDEDYDATIAIDVTRQRTFVNIAKLTGDLELSATIDQEVKTGAIVVFAVEADSTDRTVSFSTALNGPDFIIKANQTKAIAFVYNGNELLLINTPQQKELTSEILNLNFAPTLKIEVASQETIVNIGVLTNDITLTADIADNVLIGAKVYIKLKSDGTARETSLSTGFFGNLISGDAHKTKIASFVYDGTNLLHIATQQIKNN